MAGRSRPRARRAPCVAALAPGRRRLRRRGARGRRARPRGPGDRHGRGGLQRLHHAPAEPEIPPDKAYYHGPSRGRARPSTASSSRPATTDEPERDRRASSWSRTTRATSSSRWSCPRTTQFAYRAAGAHPEDASPRPAASPSSARPPARCCSSSSRSRTPRTGRWSWRSRVRAARPGPRARHLRVAQLDLAALPERRAPASERRVQHDPRRRRGRRAARAARTNSTATAILGLPAGA